MGPVVDCRARGVLALALALTASACTWGTTPPSATREVPAPAGIRQIPSPNFGERPAGQRIDAIVIHTTEGSYEGTIAHFRNTESEVSAHFVIDPQGGITQMVPVEKRAWHATYYNDRAIGIEMVGYADRAGTWNERNVEALVGLCAYLCAKHRIPVFHPEGNAHEFPGDRFDVPGLVAHGQIQPWNRTDPGPHFPWDDFVTRVRARMREARLGR